MNRRDFVFSTTAAVAGDWPYLADVARHMDKVLDL